MHTHYIFFSCIFSKIGLSNNFISLNGFLYNWSLQAIIFPRLCLDSLFNYNPVAMERDGTDLQESRGWVHKVTWEGEESEAAAQLDTGTDVPLPSPCGLLCAFLYFLSQVQHPSLPDIHADRVQSQELYSLKLWVWLWVERTSYWNWRFIELTASRKPSRKTKSNIYSLRYILFFWKNASYHCSESWHFVPLMSPVSEPLLRGCVPLVCLEACRCILVKLHAKFGCVGNLKYQSCEVSRRF